MKTCMKSKNYYYIIVYLGTNLIHMRMQIQSKIILKNTQKTYCRNTR